MPPIESETTSATSESSWRSVLAWALAYPSEPGRGRLSTFEAAVRGGPAFMPQGTFIPTAPAPLSATARIQARI